MKHLSVALALLIVVGASLPSDAAAQDEATDLSRKVAALIRAKESTLPAVRASDPARAALARDVIEAGRVREMLSTAETDAAFDEIGSGRSPISPQLRMQSRS
jgi:hypothetical protein